MQMKIEIVKALLAQGYYKDLYQVVKHEKHMLIVRYGYSYYVTALKSGQLVNSKSDYVDFTPC